LNLDFTLGTLDDRITFTRASTATYFDKDGVLQSAASGEARFDYNPSTLAPRGLLLEEQRVNSIRNNTMQGAVAGTPGTLPTNWATQNVGNVARTEVVGIGTENGIAYIDVRYTGTTSSTATGGIVTENGTFISASSGQTWASSLFVRLIAGSLSGITSINNNILERAADGTLLAQTNTPFVPTSAALNTQRISTTRTLTNASTAFVQQRVAIIPQSGVAIDITLRIGLPQLEQGATVTSVIPTTTIALTRNADVDDMTGSNFSSWYNASEGTLFVEYSAPAVGVRTIFSLNDNSANEAITLRTDGTNPLFTVTDGGSDVANIDAGTVASNVVYKFAGAYAANDFAASINGGAAVTDTSGALPTLDRATIGSLAGSNYLNGHIRRISFYPRRLSNEQLQALTA
jgi:hypothetical protein